MQTSISIRVERCFSFFETQKIEKDIVQYYHILVTLHIYIKECLWD